MEKRIELTEKQKENFAEEINTFWEMEMKEQGEEPLTKDEIDDFWYDRERKQAWVVCDKRIGNDGVIEVDYENSMKDLGLKP